MLTITRRLLVISNFSLHNLTRQPVTLAAFPADRRQALAVAGRRRGGGGALSLSLPPAWACRAASTPGPGPSHHDHDASASHGHGDSVNHDSDQARARNSGTGGSAGRPESRVRVSGWLSSGVGQVPIQDSSSPVTESLVWVTPSRTAALRMSNLPVTVTVAGRPGRRRYFSTVTSQSLGP